MNKYKFICPTCEFIKKSGGIISQKQYQFNDYKDYKKHYLLENEIAPEYKYLIDKKGEVHLSCLLVSEPDHKLCPAHPNL